MSGSAPGTLHDVLVPRNEIVHPRDNPAGEAIFVGLEHIEAGTGRRFGSLPIRLEALTGRKARFRPGDIVYGYLRPYLNKVWVADFGGYCSVDQYVFDVAGASPEYVAAYMRSPQFLSNAPIRETPGQLPRIRLNEILGVPFSAPPIEDQRRIAAELDLLLASVELASSQTSRMRAETSALRSRAVEASFESLDQSHRQPLGQLGSVDDGDWILTNDYAGSGVRLFQVGDIGRGELLAKSNRFISMDRATELRCTILRAGDILISRMPDPIGRACALPQLPYPSITAVDVTIFRPDTTRLDTEFAVQFMNSRSWLRDVAAKASGATRQRISRANMGRLRIPAPPLLVQRGIAAELSERLATIDAMESAIRAEQEAIDALPAALLRRAFDGLTA